MKFEEHDLLILRKLINFVKFESTEPESFFISNSPFINALIDKLNFESKKNNIYENKQFELDNYKRIQNVIIKKTQSLTEWTDYDRSMKESVFKQLAYPLHISNSLMDQLIKNRDVYKNPR